MSDDTIGSSSDAQLRILPEKRTANTEAAPASLVERADEDPATVLLQELLDTASGAGVDVADRAQISDLVAVAMARLAWRGGQVEDWHGIEVRRINNVDMMRANAASTRLVRGLLPDDVAEGLRADPAGLLGAVRRALSDPDRRLPDGRSLAELAPDADELATYTEQVNLVFDRCAGLVHRFGPDVVVLLLACYAATICWKWWLAPGWLSIVDKIVEGMRDPSRWPDASTAPDWARHSTPAMELGRLRDLLVTGPDQLTLDEATACRITDIGELLPSPQDHGLAARSRLALPPSTRRLIDYLEMSADGFIESLKWTYRTRR